MLAEKNTQLELLTAFLHDARWWKQALGYIETETQFIGQLLNARIYKENVPNLFERLQNFKLELETNSRETKNLMKETAGYEEQLRRILEGKDSSPHNDYLENHKEFKDRFEEFYIDFNDYKTRVLNYIGGML